MDRKTQRRAKALGIELNLDGHGESRSQREAKRRGSRNRAVGTAVAVNGAVAVGQGKVARFVVRNGDGYAVRLHGRTIASGFATPEQAERYADALHRRRYRRLADPKRALPVEPKPKDELQEQLKAKTSDKELVAELLLLANSGAVTVTVK